MLDKLIAIIAVGQEEDGYLTTWRTINPAKPPADWVKVVEGSGLKAIPYYVWSNRGLAR